MQVSSSPGNALGIITQAQQKAYAAAQTIANLPVQNGEVGGSQDIAPGDMFKPILSLKEAEQETYAGVKVLQTQKNMVGALLNVTA